MKKQVKAVVVALALGAAFQAVMSYAGSATPEQELKEKIKELVQEESVRLDTENHTEAEREKMQALLFKLEKMAVAGESFHGDGGP